MKLSEVQKKEIKTSGKNQVELAKEFGVSAATISKLKGKESKTLKDLEISFTDSHIIISIPRKLVTKPLLSHLV